MGYVGQVKTGTSIPGAVKTSANVYGSVYTGGGTPGGSGVGSAYMTVTAYGAKGDGVNDDTNAFKAALAAERVLFVPGGTYILSDTLTIEENCCLELSQDTVLRFTQTDKNCISMLRLANLKGNHATIFVPYTFGANVINCDTGDDEARLDANNLAASNNTAVPPFTKWDPQWKMSRYVTDINICKTNSAGQHYSNDGTCYGTAVYLHCNVEDFVSYMWGVSMSGLRIAGGFNYGIRLYNIGDTKDSWNHDVRIEAVIDACKVGVSVENCRYARLAVTIQPRLAGNNAKYAEHGIKLADSRGIDLSSSRVWDWNENRTKWASGNEYQHLALYGECRGLILDDFLYYEQESTDIRNLIYTNKASNLENMTILQEPIDKWFKVKDGEPYFYHENLDKKLATREDLVLLESNFNTNVVKKFTDVLPSATDTDGSIFNGVGYTRSGYIAASGEYVAASYYACTGFIPCKSGSEIHIGNMNFNSGDSNCRLVVYDANKKYINHINRNNINAGDTYYFNCRETDNGCIITIKPMALHANAAYVRFSVYHTSIGEYPMVAIDQEIKYAMAGFLSDDIKVKSDNLVLVSPGGKSFKLSVSDSGAITSTEIS